MPVFQVLCDFGRAHVVNSGETLADAGAARGGAPVRFARWGEQALRSITGFLAVMLFRAVFLAIRT